MNNIVEFKRLIYNLMKSQRECFDIINQYYKTHRDTSVFVILNETHKTVGGLHCTCNTVELQYLPFAQH